MHGFLNSGQFLQSHESLDLDNNLTLQVQHVATPRCKRRVAVNSWTNISLKRCVLTNVAQYNPDPCFGYALVLAHADPSDNVRFVLQSSDFDRPLNTSYLKRSQAIGTWLSELAGKFLQSHESLDLDTNLTLQVQHVAIPRGNGRVAVNLRTHILLKRCVLTNVI